MSSILKSSVCVSRGFTRLGIIIIIIVVVVVIVCRHCPYVSGHAFPSFIFHETGDGVRRCRSGFGFTQGNHQQLSSCQPAARSPKGHVHSETGPQHPRPLSVEIIIISPTAWTQKWEAPGCAKTKQTKKCRLIFMNLQVFLDINLFSFRKLQKSFSTYTISLSASIFCFDEIKQENLKLARQEG